MPKKRGRKVAKPKRGPRRLVPLARIQRELGVILPHEVSYSSRLDSIVRVGRWANAYVKAGRYTLKHIAELLKMNEYTLGRYRKIARCAYLKHLGRQGRLNRTIVEKWPMQLTKQLTDEEGLQEIQRLGLTLPASTGEGHAAAGAEAAEAEAEAEAEEDDELKPPSRFILEDLKTTKIGFRELLRRELPPLVASTIPDVDFGDTREWIKSGNENSRLLYAVYLADDGIHLVGYLKMDREDGLAYIRAYGVAEAYRRRGLARLLVRTLMRIFEGEDKIAATIMRGNAGSIRCLTAAAHAAGRRIERTGVVTEDGVFHPRQKAETDETYLRFEMPKAAPKPAAKARTSPRQQG